MDPWTLFKNPCFAALVRHPMTSGSTTHPFEHFFISIVIFVRNCISIFSNVSDFENCCSRSQVSFLFLDKNCCQLLIGVEEEKKRKRIELQSVRRQNPLWTRRPRSAGSIYNYRARVLFQQDCEVNSKAAGEEGGRGGSSVVKRSERNTGTKRWVRRIVWKAGVGTSGGGGIGDRDGKDVAGKEGRGGRQ